MSLTPAAVEELTVQRFQTNTTSEETAAHWRAVADAVVQIGLQSALHQQNENSMESNDEEKGSSPASRTQRDVPKSSLWFILDDDGGMNMLHDDTVPPLDMGDLEEKSTSPIQPAAAAVASRASTHEYSDTSSDAESHTAAKRRKFRRTSAAPVAPISVSMETMMPPPQRTERKRKARRRPPSRICKFEGCEQYVVDQGLCVRHGGGKRCQTEGCTSRAKHQGKCWKHGGSTACKVVGCPNRAKSRGYCWSHGGGTKCKSGSCGKIAISNGLCWAHGGGKRCIVEGCKRQAYERTQNYCNTHYSELVTASASSGHDGEGDGSDEAER